MNKLLTQVKRCINWASLYRLNDDFMRNGMVIKLTESGRHTLCRIEDGMAIHENILTDFIFIESPGNEYQDISKHSKDTIIQFIINNANDNQLRPRLPSYMNNTALYGNVIRINNEKSVMEGQEIRSISRLLQE